MTDIQRGARQLPYLALAQLACFSRRMNARDKQNLASQVITQSSQKRLIQIDRIQGSARKRLALQTLCDFPPGEVGIEDIGTNAL